MVGEWSIAAPVLFWRWELNEGEVRWYREHARLARRSQWMNHGYFARLGGKGDMHSQALIELLLGYAPFKINRVLDVGCGMGASLTYMSERFAGYHCWGVDPIVENLMFAENRSAVIVGESEHLPFGSNAFDLTVSVEALHLFDCVESGLLEMVRVTRSRGVVAVADGIPRDSQLPLKALDGMATLIDDSDITAGVIASLRDKKRAFKRELVPREISLTFEEEHFVDEAWRSVYEYVLPGLEAGVFCYRMFAWRVE